jgi:hypothetical protein
MAENTRNKDRQRQQNTGDRKPPDRGQDAQRRGQRAGQPPPGEPDELSDLSKGVTDDEELEEERITQRTPRQSDDVDPPKR